MANFDVTNPVYSNEMRMLRKTDPAHANTFNPLFEQLLKNDEAIRHMKDESTGATYHFGVDNGMLYIEADN